jgi:hypothetical protein
METSVGNEINDECDDGGRVGIEENNYIRRGVT